MLAGDVSEARADGKLDDERYRNIRSAMELVRVDLEAAIQAAADEAARARLLEEQARLQQQLTELQNQGDGGAPETGGGPAPGGGEENKKGKNGKGEDGKGEGGKEGKGDKK
ncbi:hypothetical protein [Agromyces salentinus]|uniref:hypothetical protein n=1 Tax=Agromyces salentinus TaxID=269421 RepID=UPI00147906C1|nr:hypothetical protein [Agromyces salentinus]